MRFTARDCRCLTICLPTLAGQLCPAVSSCSPAGDALLVVRQIHSESSLVISLLGMGLNHGRQTVSSQLMQDTANCCAHDLAVVSSGRTAETLARDDIRMASSPSSAKAGTPAEPVQRAM